MIIITVVEVIREILSAKKHTHTGTAKKRDHEVNPQRGMGEKIWGLKHDNEVVNKIKFSLISKNTKTAEETAQFCHQ